jgi:hypothetical protein
MQSGEMTIAQLDEAQLKRLQQAERELGVVLVALQPQYTFAQLPEDKLRRLLEMEKELGVVLLAYQHEK